MNVTNGTAERGTGTAMQKQTQMTSDTHLMWTGDAMEAAKQAAEQFGMQYSLEVAALAESTSAAAGLLTVPMRAWQLACEAIPAPVPTPTEPTPPTRGKRQSREAAYNARVQAAYNTLRETAGDGHENHRCYRVASTSDPTVHYTVTWDTDSDHTHCDCTAGQYGRDCVHQAAMRRLIAGLHAADARRADAAVQAQLAEESRRRDTSRLRRNNQPFSLMR